MKRNRHPKKGDIYIMTKYFKNVKSFDDLKKQYKELLKKHHPDNGGDVEEMKNINVEFDSLFPIWKNRKETEVHETVKDTADSVRSQFYTEFGWEGSNHRWNRTLKEVAQIVRTYVKEKYPTYKFSVRTSYASMCKELHVTLKESPIPIYKTFEELTNDDFEKIGQSLFPWNWVVDERMNFLNASREEKEKIIRDSTNAYKNVLNEATRAVIQDVDNFVKSYNYHDCDGMMDYFHVDFYYFGCCQDNGKNIKIVPKTARIKNRSTALVKQDRQRQQPEKTESTAIEEKNTYTFKITHGEDTRDGSELWVVRIEETLTKDEYIRINKAVKDLGGYYSKFKHGFIFRFEPSEALKKIA
jgi:hypothetical protein